MSGVGIKLRSGTSILNSTIPNIFGLFVFEVIENVFTMDQVVLFSFIKDIVVRDLNYISYN